MRGHGVARPSLSRLLAWPWEERVGLENVVVEIIEGAIVFDSCGSKII